MAWAAAIGEVAGPAFGFLDTLIYSQQEQQQHAVGFAQAEALRQQSDAQLSIAQMQGQLAQRQLASEEARGQQLQTTIIIGGGIALAAVVLVMVLK